MERSKPRMKPLEWSAAFKLFGAGKNAKTAPREGDFVAVSKNLANGGYRVQFVKRFYAAVGNFDPPPYVNGNDMFALEGRMKKSGHAARPIDFFEGVPCGNGHDVCRTLSLVAALSGFTLRSRTYSTALDLAHDIEKETRDGRTFFLELVKK